LAVRHGEQFLWMFQALAYVTGAAWGYLGAFFLARRRPLWTILGAVAGGGAGGLFVGIFYDAVRDSLAPDSGGEVLVHVALGAGTGLMLALVLTALLRSR
jgi:4-amino-4-deoxy-L-arabinose transferase-like glycosyltransferase